jgi:hypothetical protein
MLEAELWRPCPEIACPRESGLCHTGIRRGGERRDKRPDEAHFSRVVVPLKPKGGGPHADDAGGRPIAAVGNAAVEVDTDFTGGLCAKEARAGGLYAKNGLADAGAGAQVADSSGGRIGGGGDVDIVDAAFVNE